MCFGRSDQNNDLDFFPGLEGQTAKGQLASLLDLCFEAICLHNYVLRAAFYGKAKPVPYF